MKKIILMCCLIAVANFCEASSIELNNSLPWKSGMSTLLAELTGPIPQALAIIALAVQATIWVSMEMGPFTPHGVKICMGIIFGVTIAINSLGFVNAITGHAAGLPL